MMGSDDLFIDRYAVPVGVLVDVWEKFYEEVYKPGKIEHRKNIGGVTFMYGLPEGDYGDKTFFNSMYSEKKYFIMKDNKVNEYILGVDVNWEWKDGVDLKKLYYKTFKNKNNIKDVLKNNEFSFLMKELKGAEVDYSEEEVRSSYEFLDKNIISLKKEAAENYDGHLVETLADLLDYEGIVDANHNLYGSDVMSLSKYLLDYYEIINQF